jgi:hypothetical protein
MSSKIDAQIDRIRSIFADLKTGLMQEQEKSKALSLELQRVKDTMEHLKLQNLEHTNKRSEFPAASSTNLQDIKVHSAEIIHRREAEIDALVKEIEFCIRKLKNKHA